MLGFSCWGQTSSRCLLPNTARSYAPTQKSRFRSTTSGIWYRAKCNLGTYPVRMRAKKTRECGLCLHSRKQRDPDSTVTCNCQQAALSACSLLSVWVCILASKIREANLMFNTPRMGKTVQRRRQGIKVVYYIRNHPRKGI